MDCNHLFSVIDELNNQYCDIWENVCNIESPTSHKQGIDAVGNIFIGLAKERQMAVEVMEHDQAGNAICITLNPESQERPVVFSGHIDTVHPVGLFGTPAVHRDQQCIYGPGVTDCKGGVVASMMAMVALAQCGFQKRPVKLLIQTDEETDSTNSEQQTIAFMLHAAKDAIAFLNTEVIQDNTVVLIRKGILRYRFTVLGKAVHSAQCMDGANAICEAAHKIIELETMKDPHGLTCNCGVIQGGTVPNSVAESCEFVADIRFANNEQLQTAIELCEKVAQQTTVTGCSCRLEKLSLRPAMPITDQNVALLAKINKIYATCGLPCLTSRSCLSGSDAAYTTQAGIPTVDNIGVRGHNIHSIREFAYLDSLAACAKRLAIVAMCI